MTYVEFVLVSKTGAIVAGPFTTIDHVPAGIDWATVTIKVLTADLGFCPATGIHQGRIG